MTSEERAAFVMLRRAVVTETELLEQFRECQYAERNRIRQKLNTTLRVMYPPGQAKELADDFVKGDE